MQGVTEILEQKHWTEQGGHVPCFEYLLNVVSHLNENLKIAYFALKQNKQLFKNFI